MIGPRAGERGTILVAVLLAVFLMGTLTLLAVGTAKSVSDRLSFQKDDERLVAMPGVRCPKPTGAFYCFPNVSGTYDRLGVSGSGEFAGLLLAESRVAVVPGIAFGLDAHVRISFATSMEQIEQGLDRIEAFLNKT